MGRYRPKIFAATKILKTLHLRKVAVKNATWQQWFYLRINTTAARVSTNISPNLQKIPPIVKIFLPYLKLDKNLI